MNRYVVVVGHDVDPASLEEVVWACRPWERLSSFPPVARSDPEYLAEIHERRRGVLD